MADNLPDKLFECDAEVIVYLEQTALVHIKDGNQIGYVSADICHSRRIRVGDTVQINARLAPKECLHPDIPYICKSIWSPDEPVPSHTFPRMMERYQIDELENYIKWAPKLQQKIPTEFDKFIQKEDFSALGGLLAMQGIIDDAPLQKKSKKKGEDEIEEEVVLDDSSSKDSKDHDKDKKKKHKKKKRKKDVEDNGIIESDNVSEKKEEKKKKRKKKDSYSEAESDVEIIEKKSKRKKKHKKKDSSSSSEDDQEEKSTKKKKKKDKKKKEKKSKKRKHKHSSSEDSDLEIAKKVKKKHKIDVNIEDVPHHLVLHKLNDMIQELEKGVDPDQLKELLTKDKPDGNKEKEMSIVSYPKIGEAYDPKAINTWSNLRGFQSSAVSTLKSNWLGLSVVPGANQSTLPQPNLNFGKEETEGGEDGRKSGSKSATESDQDEQSDKEDTSSENTPNKASVFKDIFGEEREPSPEQKEDEVPVQAFVRKDKEDQSKKKSKSKNLALALQSRLNRTSAQDQDKEKEAFEHKHYERKADTYNKKQPYKHYKRSRSRSNSDPRGHKMRPYYPRSYQDRPRSGSREMSRNSGDYSRHSRERSRYSRGESMQRSSRQRSSSRHKQRSSSRQKSRHSKPRSSILTHITGSASRSEKSESESSSSHSSSDDSEESGKNKKLKKKSLKKNKKKRSSKVSVNYSEDDMNHKDSSQSDSDNQNHQVEEAMKLEDDEEDDKMIERIRKQRARLVATLPSADRQLQEIAEENGNSCKIKFNNKARGGVPITSFQQDAEAGGEEKKFKTVILTGSTLSDGSMSQLFQISATVQGDVNSYYQCAFPEVLKKYNSLNSATRKEIMETLQLKSSKFDVSREGLLNVYYKHPKNSSAKTVTEKDLLLGLLIFLQGLGESVVLFLHHKDSLLPVLLAKINHYKLFDHFSSIVVSCCDMVALAWSLHMDQLWSGKHYPSLRTIAESLEPGKEMIVNQENASSVLGGVLDKVMNNQQININRIIEMSNQRSLAEYMSIKSNLIQSVITVESDIDSKAEYLEQQHSYEAADAVNTKVNLVWTTLEEIKKMLVKGERKSVEVEKRSTSLHEHDQGKLGSGRDSEVTWESKSYKCFLAPGQIKLQGNDSIKLELRVPALQLRMTELRGKLALLEKHPDFTLCDVDSMSTTIRQSDLSLFPIVNACLRNTGSEELLLNSKTFSDPIATVRLKAD